MLFQMMQQIPCFNAKSFLSNKSKYSKAVDKYSNLSLLLCQVCAYSHAKWHSKTPGLREYGKCLRNNSRYETAEFGA